MTIEFLLDTWKFCRTHLVAFAYIILPFTVPLEIISTVYHQSFDYGDSYALAALPELVYLLVYPVFGAAVIFYMASVLEGQRLSVSESWNLGLKHWGSYFVLMIILVIVVGLGFAFFVLPGVLLMAKFAFSEFDLLLQRKNPLESLQSSWEKTSEHFWVLVKGGLVITAIVYIPIWAVSYLLGESGLFSGIAGSALRILESLLMVAYTVFAYRVYDNASQRQ